MAICRYYQQGNCRFGNRCRFEHVSEEASFESSGYRQGRGGYNSSSHGESYNRYGRAEEYQSRGNNRYSALAYEHEDYQDDRYSSRGGFKTQQSNWNYDESNQHRRENDAYSYRAPVSSNQRSSYQPDKADYRGSQPHHRDRNQGVDNQSEVNEILSYISEDMALWEESNMWLFSCYAFQRAAVSLPGLDDLSIEEVRLQAYEARASGKTSDYLSYVSALKNEYALKRQQLMKPNSATKASLIQLIRDALRQGCTETAAGQRFVADSVSTNTSNHNNASLGSQTQAFSFGSGPSPAAFGFVSGAPTSQGGQRGPDWGTASGPGGQNFLDVAAASLSGSGAFSSAFANSAQPVAVSATGFTNPAQPVPASAAVLAGQNVSTGQPTYSAPQVHTPVEQLLAEDRTQFEAAKFTLGCVPLRPPPQLMV